MLRLQLHAFLSARSPSLPPSLALCLSLPLSHTHSLTSLTHSHTHSLPGPTCQVANLEAFDTERSISLVPPDGEFALVNYRTSHGLRLPFRLTVNTERDAAADDKARAVPCRPAWQRGCLLAARRTTG